MSTADSQCIQVRDNVYL